MLPINFIILIIKVNLKDLNNKKLTPEQLHRYSRQLMTDDIGYEGQQKLLSSRVLIIGAGGLGCPVAAYLAGAGAGEIGIVDYDLVELSNLHRQPLFRNEDVGKLKAVIAAERISEINPDIKVTPIAQKLMPENAIEIIEGFDIVVDGSDNFETRYLVNDTCVILSKPLVYGAVYKSQGQVSVFNCLLKDSTRSGTYRCLFPEMSNNNELLNCSETGISGALPGITGTIMANETIKLICGSENLSADMLLVFDVKLMQFTNISYSRNQSLWHDAPATADEILSYNYSAKCNSKQVQDLDNSISDPPEFHPDENTVYVDVREYHESLPLVRGTVHIPVSELTERVNEIRDYHRVVFICNHGNKSRFAVKLMATYLKDSILEAFEGGFDRLIKSGDTIIHG